MAGIYLSSIREEHRLRQHWSISDIGVAPSSQYLDALATPPLLVFSLRKRISTATSAIRVRRSSDNTEQDIGFDGDALDTASLASFVGAGSGFVTAFYDQTGNGYNAGQTTAAKQPRVVNAGTYDGKLVFDGVDDALVASSIPYGTQFAGVYSKVKLVPGGNYKMIVEHGPDAGTTAGGWGFYGNNDSVNWDFVMSNGSGAARGRRHALSLTSLDQITALFDRSLTGDAEIKVWRAGTAQSGSTTAGTEQTGNFSVQNLYIGARTASSLFADMWLETLAIYSADSSIIRSDIEAIVA